MPEQPLPARGSLRSRAAAALSAGTLRQVSAASPPEPEATAAMREVTVFIANMLEINTIRAVG